MNREKLLLHHNLILQKLLDWKITHPEFTFWLRKNESSDPDKNRLRQGYWFQGNDDYIFVGLSNQSGGTNMTRSIGWVVDYRKQNEYATHLEVVWPGEKNQAKIGFYKTVINKLGNFKRKNEVTYKKELGSASDENGLFDLLNKFLNNEYQTLKDLMIEAPEAEMIIPESVFQSLLAKINSIKPALLKNDDNIIIKEIEIEYPSAFASHGQLQEDFISLLEIPDGVKKVSVTYNNFDYNDLTLGQEGAGRGRIYFPNNGKEFIKNNQSLIGGQKIKILVGWFQSENKLNVMKNIINLNTILYGPPGTGKTYNTIDEALKIVAKSEYDDTIRKYSADEKIQREKVIELFNSKLIKSEPEEKIDWKKTDGKIAFCTFHQSFSYEDFIEGIKPNTDGKEISYTIEDGIFKLMCDLSSRSSNNSSKIVIPDNSRFTKLLVPTLDDLNYCVNNKLVGVKIGISTGQENYFKNSLSSADNTHIVLLTFDNKLIKAIGLITGECKPDPTGRFNLVREVKWLYPDCSIEIASFYTAKINENVLDDLNEKDVKKVIEENLKGKTDNSNYVLIIDEINRGNVSQIFGELITLIESDKRKDTDNELSVILPYSKQSFSVPKNLYLIGTMNTADRSVEALDTALRRRFDFTEMPPLYSKLENKVLTISGKTFKLDLILETINNRLKVLLTKDHQIGHSYFLRINETVTLQVVFKNNILPLLQEYFYGDFAKICMVLGKDFISEEIAKEKNKTKLFFAYSKHESTDDFLEKEIWNLNTSIFEEGKEAEFAIAIDNMLNPKKESE